MTTSTSSHAAQGEQPLGLNLSDAAVRFATADHEYFHVEVATIGNDIVYHFWPAESHQLFHPAFSKALEDGFKAVLPVHADVRAQYYSPEEVLINGMMRQGGSLVAPVPTFWVKVIGWAKRAGADARLKHKVFAEIDRIMKERVHAA